MLDGFSLMYYRGQAPVHSPKGWAVMIRKVYDDLPAGRFFGPAGAKSASNGRKAAFLFIRDLGQDVARKMHLAALPEAPSSLRPGCRRGRGPFLLHETSSVPPAKS
jgi:hypothetical protein